MSAAYRKQYLQRCEHIVNEKLAALRDSAWDRGAMGHGPLTPERDAAMRKLQRVGQDAFETIMALIEARLAP